MKRTKHPSHVLVLLLIVPLFIGNVRPALANPHDVVPGCFVFYDRTLDKDADRPDNQSGLGQAEIIEGQEQAKLFEWNNGVGRCLRFSPEKLGDSVSFRIHIGEANSQTAYAVKTSVANFYNEGIYQFFVDDQPVGPQHDCYSEQSWKHGNFPVVQGDYKITYRYVGKNPKSTGCVLNICWIEFL